MNGGRAEDSQDVWSYALLTPDAVLAGQVAPIAELLGRRGLGVVTGRPLALDVPTMRTVYSDPDAPPSAPTSGSLRTPAVLYAGLYELAASCLLVLRRTAGGAPAAGEAHISDDGCQQPPGEHQLEVGISRGRPRPTGWFRPA